MRAVLIGILVLLATACGDNKGVAQISGRVDPATFGEPVDTVVVSQGGATVQRAPIAPDGTFAVVVGSGSQYHLSFDLASSRVGLISPRPAGTFDTTFAVRGAGTFDLGQVRRVATPLDRSYHYRSGTTTDAECDDDGEDSAGAVCVDDDAEEGSTCGDDENENDDGETEDGGDDGESDDDEKPEIDMTQAAAVSEHNLPTQIGCDDDHENEGEEEGDL